MAYLEWNRHVDQIEVDVVESELLQRLSQSRLHLGLSVVVQPELGDDEELLSLHSLLLHVGRKSLSDLLLIAVARSCVDMAISCVEGGANC